VGGTQRQSVQGVLEGLDGLQREPVIGDYDLLEDRAEPGQFLGSELAKL
jgi:hypothetical protein